MAVSVSRSIRTLPILVAAKTRSRGTGAGGREARKDERAGEGESLCRLPSRSCARLELTKIAASIPVQSGTCSVERQR